MSLQERMQEMFTRMVEAKDVSLVDVSYDPAFVLTTNGQRQDLAVFRDGRLLRLHEVTWPDWSTAPALEAYGSSPES